MNKELEEVYYEGFVNSYWSKNERGWAYLDQDNHNNIFVGKMMDIEKRVFGRELDAEKASNTLEFQAAKKKWDELQSSPLYQALL